MHSNAMQAAALADGAPRWSAGMIDDALTESQERRLLADVALAEAQHVRRQGMRRASNSSPDLQV